MTIHRFARVRHQEHVLFGEVIGESFEVRSAENSDGEHHKGSVLPIRSLQFLPPVKPSKVVAIALNYRAHAEEMKKPIPQEPMFFLKPTTAIIGPKEAIHLPPQSAEVHFEGEMGVVIGKQLTRASPEQAKEAIYGLTCVNDVTARDIQRRQNHYTRSKGFDTFCPIGPFLVTGLDPTDLGVKTRVNGEVRQDGRTDDMIFGTYELLSFVSHIMTLLPGDVVSTGTPPGVGQLRAGDRIEIEVEGVGVLENTVVGDH